MVKINTRKQQVKNWNYEQKFIIIPKEDLKKLNWDTSKEFQTSTRGNKFIVEPKEV